MGFLVYPGEDIPGCTPDVLDSESYDEANWEDCIRSCAALAQNISTPCAAISHHDGHCWMKSQVDEVHSPRQSFPGATSAILHFFYGE